MGASTKPKSVQTLLEESHVFDHNDGYRGEILEIETGDHDAYNPTAPFEFGGNQYLFARIEQRDDELGTTTALFEYDSSNHNWKQFKNFTPLPLQDPFVVKLQDEWVLGGVRVYPRLDDPSKIDYWETQLLRGPDPFTPRPFISGPRGMKDIRLLQMKDGRVGVFTRHQGKIGGRGKAGFIAVDKLDDINCQVLENSPIINDLYADSMGEWGGIAEAYDIGNGSVGAVGHIARFSPNGNGSKEYFGHSCVVDIGSFSVSDEVLLTCRSCFPPTEYKRPDIENVVFLGGVALEDNRTVAYCGLSDAASGKIPVQLPFRPAIF